jgi:hypothetical protein
MKINIDPVVSSRIKATWAQLTPMQQAQLAPEILGANDQAVQVAQTGAPPAFPAAPHTLVLAHSALTHDSDAIVSNLEAGVVITVGPDVECPIFCAVGRVSVAQLFLRLIGPVFLYQA